MVKIVGIVTSEYQHVIDKYNAVVGFIVALLAVVFGELWYLFALFMLFNIIDFLTGWWKARQLKAEKSRIGAIGAAKKVGYWAIILIAFAIPRAFIDIGQQVGVNLEITRLLGYFTLASLMINEIRSILENLVQLGYAVPIILIKGLAITDKLLNAQADNMTNTEDDHK